jgi:hypothetical protein
MFSYALGFARRHTLGTFWMPTAFFLYLFSAAPLPYFQLLVRLIISFFRDLGFSPALPRIFAPLR